MDETAPLLDIIKQHRTLEMTLEAGREQFVSDWNGAHPFVKNFLGPKLVQTLSEKADTSKYVYYDDQTSILDGIRNIHLSFEDLQIARDNIVAGPGSSSLLLGFCLWLFHNGYDEVFYAPPLYYTLHFFLRLLKINTRPISGKHPFEPGATLNLPNRRTVLFLTDPVWFAGYRLSASQVAEVVKWQMRTGSIVFVDGSFQFTQWDGTRRERTADLAQELTFRLICPTKALAIPCFRFAYLLHPLQFHNDLLFLYESALGGGSITDVAFAGRALRVLNRKSCNRALTNYFSESYYRLIDANIIQTDVLPESGYFVFAKPTDGRFGGAQMSEEYFELRGYPGYIRINLMIANAILDRNGDTH